LNIFNAALVTPTYYVCFTSSTIITSAILFRGFKGTATSIITVVMGFFVICAGVVLLQLSKSAKDVPDAAVFAGNLDQVRTIAEQEQPETEPKADAIRGAAAIVRRFSVTRQKMEMEEARRLHEEKLRDLEPIGEEEHVEWDGLRRRRTTLGTQSSRGRGNSTPRAPNTPAQHPPLGMSHFPSYDEEEANEENRPNTGGLGSSFFGSIRNRAKSMVSPGPGYGGQQSLQSPMYPVPLTEISIPQTKGSESPYGPGEGSSRVYSLPAGLEDHKTAYEGAGSQHIQFADNASERTGSRSSLGPVPPPHSARRQFSFFRKGQASAPEEPYVGRIGAPRKGIGSRQSSASGSQVKGATEEERLGLVKGDTSNTELPQYEEEDDGIDEDWDLAEEKRKRTTPPLAPSLPPVGRVVAGSSPSRGSPARGSPPREGKEKEDEAEFYDRQRHNWNESRGPPRFNEGRDDGAFI
jgi:magnesium transporter